MSVNYLIPPQDLEDFDGRINSSIWIEKPHPPNFIKAMDTFKKWKDAGDGLELHRSILKSPKKVLRERIKNFFMIQSYYTGSDEKFWDLEGNSKVARWYAVSYEIQFTLLRHLRRAGIPFERYEDLYWENVSLVLGYITNRLHDIGVTKMQDCSERAALHEKMQKRMSELEKDFPNLARLDFLGG